MSPDKREALEGVIDILLRGIEEHSDSEEHRLTAGIMRKAKNLSGICVNKITRFTGDKTGMVTTETLKAAIAALDQATAILNNFLNEHPVPELTIYDHNVTPIKPD